MSRALSDRKLEVYRFHGHLGAKHLPDYARLFATIAAISAEDRTITKRNHLITLSTCVEDSEGLFHLIAHEGEPGLQPLILNLASMRERSSRLQRDELVTTRTHAVLDPRRRVAAIEYNQRGVKASDLSELINKLGRERIAQNLSFEFTPVIRPSFWDDVDRLGRIRLASVTLTKPNPGWSDDADSLIGGLDESSAQRVKLEVAAPPNESLNRRHGFLAKLRQLIVRGSTSIKQALVEGNREEGVKTTVRLANHVEHRNVQVKRDQAGHPDSEAIDEYLIRYLAELQVRNLEK